MYRGIDKPTISKWGITLRISQLMETLTKIYIEIFLKYGTEICNDNFMGVAS